MGADYATLRALTPFCRELTDQGRSVMRQAKASALLRTPLTAFETSTFKRRYRDIEIPAPVFILGHWRSGTTHLYNLLGATEAFGYVSPLATGLPWNMFTINRWFRPLLERCLPKSRLIDAVPVNPNSPQEDEFAIANMSPLSFCHALYFPKSFEMLFNRGVFFEGVNPSQVDAWKERLVHFLSKVYIEQDRKPLIIKNPVYTARVRTLLEIWPNARFIHIHRNPAEVFLSMCHFYKKLLPALALQNFDHIDIKAHVMKTYARMMDQLIEDRKHIPDAQWCEFSYDHLIKEPYACLSELYDKLVLGDFESHLPVIQKYLSQTRSYRKNHFECSPEDRNQIYERWGKYFEHFGYGKA